MQCKHVPPQWRSAHALVHSVLCAAARAHSQYVHANALGAVLGRAMHKAQQLVDARVHAAIRQQADKVQGVLRERLTDVLPPVQLERRPILQRDVHEPRTLINHLPGACERASRAW